MVSALDSKVSSPGSSPAGDIVLCTWARHFSLIKAHVIEVQMVLVSNYKMFKLNTSNWTPM